MPKALVAVVLLALASPAFAAETLVRGTSLTELGANNVYDANETPDGPKTQAQKIVDQLYDTGVRHIVLSPRAQMKSGRGSEVEPLTKQADRTAEKRRYLRLIKYIHGKRMTVGIRPIFFVVDAQGKTPFREKQSDNSFIDWWHGNILPESPNAWFDSFKTFLDIYVPVAKLGAVEEFTLGAELYTMTVGIEDHPYLKFARNDADRVKLENYKFGFPAQWLGIVNYLRPRLPKDCRIMYDINFTDDKIGAAGGLEQYGGEFARWKYRLVDLATQTDPEQKKAWQGFVDFWKGLDAIGIDMYRSLADKNQAIPAKQDDLVAMLKVTADRFATQIDTAMFEIEEITKKKQFVIFKEIGYRSVEKGFVDPFVYAEGQPGKLSLEHQAAAYKAIFLAFQEPKFEWFRGITFWDASIDPKLHGPTDLGFSFLGKPPTEAVVRDFFRDNRN